MDEIWMPSFWNVHAHVRSFIHKRACMKPNKNNQTRQNQLNLIALSTPNLEASSTEFLILYSAPPSPRIDYQCVLSVTNQQLKHGEHTLNL